MIEMINTYRFIVVFLCFSIAQSLSANQIFNIEIITEKLNSPWGMALLPDNRFLVTERSGNLRYVNRDGKVSAPISGLPKIAAVGQGGLLDVTLHPQFQRNRKIYFSFVEGNRFGGYSTEVAVAELNDNHLENVRVIFRSMPKLRGGRHFGGRLLIDNNDFLYLSLGDRGERHLSQELNSHHGSMIRLHLDGSIPDDNPFIGRTDSLPEIFSFGHRNIQGLALHPQTGQVWSHEHGPQGGDEVNLIIKGANYGWPVITYGVNYVIGTTIGEGTHKDGMLQPVHHWDPSIAPSGMAFYRGDAFFNWQNDALIGALKLQHLNRLQFNGEVVVAEHRYLENSLGRVRDVRVGDDGFIYLLTDAYNGKLVKLSPKIKNQ